MDSSPPGSSVHGISQARILEWAAISFSSRSSWPRDHTHISCIGRQILSLWGTWEALNNHYLIHFHIFWKHRSARAPPVPCLALEELACLLSWAAKQLEQPGSLQWTSTKTNLQGPNRWVPLSASTLRTTRNPSRRCWKKWVVEVWIFHLKSLVGLTPWYVLWNVSRHQLLHSRVFFNVAEYKHYI